MKKLVTAIALASLIAAPAFAASSRHPRNHAPAAQSEPYYDVYVNGQYRGHDRDARVRIELERDVQIGSGN